MKKQAYRKVLLFITASLPLIALTASADVLLTDSFLVSSNSQNVNQELARRQSGPLAPAQYVGWANEHQVGNISTDVGQPGGATNGNYVLLAGNGSFFSQLNIASVATGPLSIEFDMYENGANAGGAGDGTWGAVTLRAGGDGWPIAGAGEFGFLWRNTGGIQAFQNGQIHAIDSWDVVGFATNTHWTLIFSDTAGTGSAFSGSGSQVTMINGTTMLGAIALEQLHSAGLRLGFRNLDNRYVGISNLKISGTPAVLPPLNHNLSFEYDRTMPGSSVNFVPTGWTGFNGEWHDYCGSQYPGGSDFSAVPLSAPAEGNQFFWLNNDRSGVLSGIYQDMGVLQPNTIYTLTVAIGNRKDMNCTAGIISLVNGTDNTGTVLATTTGRPTTQDTWQDYTATFGTGALVSGDLTIVLSALGASTIQADFDNVRLSAVVSPVPLPIRVQDISPASAKAAVGSNVVFTAAFSNLPPVNLQWQQVVSGTPNVTNNINTGVVTVTNSGVVTSTLTLNNLQLGNAGSYQLKAANATNFVTVFYTGAAPLAVIPTITWYPPGAYNHSFLDNSVLALAGSVADEVYGVNFGVGSVDTANHYHFDDYLDSGNMSLAGTVTVVGGYEGNPSTGDGDFDNILNNGVSGTSANTGTLNNLTVGQTYTVLVLLDDTHSSGATGPAFQVTDGLTFSPAQRFAFPNGTPAIGGYIMGTFTARATTQPLTVLQNGNAQYVAVLLEKGIALPPSNAPELTKDILPLLSRVTTGTPVTLSVEVGGSLPLHFQWFDQNGPISAATNSSYTVNALNGTNYYHVSVSNPVSALVSSTSVVISSPGFVSVNNFSFENGTAGSGNTVYPVSWTPFNNDWSTVSGDTSHFSPAVVPDGTQFYARNTGPNATAGGIYQDVGALLANTTYTLTVAIGRRNDNGVPDPKVAGQWSPGTISLINGTNNTGTLLASTNGYPDTMGTWQDYSVTFTTGTTVSGDLTVELVVAPAATYQATFDNVRLSKVVAQPSVAPKLGSSKNAGDSLIVTATGGTPNAPYTWLTTTNLSAPINWTTNTSGTLDSTGSFSNALPITATQPARFFRLRLP